MKILILIVVVVISLMFPAVKCVLCNIISVIYYLPRDIYHFFKHKDYNKCITGVIVAINGLFGKGKTLTAVYMVIDLYMRKNGRIVWCKRRKKFVKQVVKIISNVELKIPYERFESLSQVVYCAENNSKIDDENDTLTVTLVLGDEFSVQMNSRNFKSNIDALFLNTILTCRHYNIALYYTSQRFMHVDALLRQVTSYCIECNKIWRLQGLKYYDAWQLENVASSLMVKPYKHLYWFVKDKHYNAYDTYACVGNLSKSCKEGDMLTSKEILELQSGGLETGQVLTPSRKYKKIIKR